MDYEEYLNDFARKHNLTEKDLEYEKDIRNLKNEILYSYIGKSYKNGVVGRNIELPKCNW